MSHDYRLGYVVPALLNSAYGKTFLDIACGIGRWGIYIQNYLKPNKLVGIDIWKPYLASLKRKKVYDDLILADAAYLPIKKGTFDVCLLCDVIEHMDKEKGERMLKSVQNVAGKAVIVTTPNYHYVQSVLQGNPFEQHVSFWNFKQFQQRGYKVFGIGFQLNRIVALGHMPIVMQRPFARLIMKGELLKFSELIAMIKRPR